MVAEDLNPVNRLCKFFLESTLYLLMSSANIFPQGHTSIWQLLLKQPDPIYDVAFEKAVLLSVSLHHILFHFNALICFGVCR